MQDKVATVHRMLTKSHICPFGIRTVELLKSHGFKVDDHHLKDRNEVDAFKAEHDVKTTPQTFIDGNRVGGYEDVRRHLGLEVVDRSKKTYRPVLAIFAISALLALVTQFTLFFNGVSDDETGVFASLLISTLMSFVAYAMVLLAVQKLQDVFSFANSFMTYDLLALKKPGYANVYPYLEAYVGLAMLAGLPALLISPVAVVIGSIGAISVIKAVYIDKRDLKCACVGGNSNVPLGFISLTENVVMVAAGILMFIL